MKDSEFFRQQRIMRMDLNGIKNQAILEFKKLRRADMGENKDIITVRAQSARYEKVRKFLERKYPDVSQMTKSEYFDFVVFMFEGFLVSAFPGEYVGYNDIQKNRMALEMEKRNQVI